MNVNELTKRLSAQNKTKWYNMTINNDVSDVYIYDEVSWAGVTADDFVKDLNDIKSGTIRLHINTPGGNVFDGITIYNALKQHQAKVETYIDGLAASIGSIIAMAGDDVYMSENAFFMIHSPFCITAGSAEDLRKTAEMLDKIGETIINTLSKESGSDIEKVKGWVADETWFTAKEALDAGFVDKIIDGEEVDNKYDLSVFDNAPESLVNKKEKGNSPLTMMELALELEKRS